MKKHKKLKPKRARMLAGIVCIGMCAALFSASKPYVRAYMPESDCMVVSCVYSTGMDIAISDDETRIDPSERYAQAHTCWSKERGYPLPYHGFECKQGSGLDTAGFTYFTKQPASYKLGMFVVDWVAWTALCGAIIFGYSLRQHYRKRNGVKK